MKHTAKLRVKVLAPDAEHLAYHVHLPTYTMVPGSWLPIVPGRVDKDGVLAVDDHRDPVVLTPAEIAQLTCEVQVPDDLIGPDGRPDKVKIRAKYKGQPRWDHDKVGDDV